MRDDKTLSLFDAPPAASADERNPRGVRAKLAAFSFWLDVQNKGRPNESACLYVTLACGACADKLNAHADSKLRAARSFAQCAAEVTAIARANGWAIVPVYGSTTGEITIRCPKCSTPHEGPNHGSKGT